MDKAFYKSKTVWGFGLAVLIALAQMYGVVPSESMITQLAQGLTTVLGIVGYRQAMK